MFLDYKGAATRFIQLNFQVKYKITNAMKRLGAFVLMVTLVYF